MCISNLDSGGRPLNDEYGLVDGMKPIYGLVDENGMAVALYLTKPPTKGWNVQEIHLVKLIRPPDDMLAVLVGRN